MVVAYKPFTPKSYQDIIDNDTVSINFERHDSFFKNSFKSSKNRQFYDKINHRIFSLKDKPKEFFVKYFEGNKDRQTIDLLFGLHISFDFDINAIGMINRICSSKIYSNDFKEKFNISLLDRIHDDVYPWMSSDPETDPIMLLSIKRKGFKPHVGIIDRIKRVRQAGVRQMFIRLADNQKDFMVSLYGFKKKDKEFQDCLRHSRVVKLYDVDYSDINIKNMKWLFYIFFALIFASFVVLLYESWKH